MTSGLPDREGRTASVLAANGDEPGVFYAINNQGLYRSADAGKEWDRLEVSWPGRYYHQHPRALLVTGGGRLTS